MATINFRFTPQQPNAMFGTTVIRFDRLVMTKGEIENIEFLIMWQSKKQTQTGETIVTHTQSFQPLGFIETTATSANSKVYEFRKAYTPPIYQLGENMGVELVAHHEGGPVDCTLSVEIDPI